MSADELIFEVIDVASGSDHKICPHALGASAVELYAVYSADIIDVDGVSVLNGQGRISGIGDIRSVICCTSGIRAARCGSVVRTAAAAVRTRVGIDDQDNNKNDDDKDRDADRKDFAQLPAKLLFPSLLSTSLLGHFSVFFFHSTYYPVSTDFDSIFIYVREVNDKSRRHTAHERTGVYYKLKI